MLPIMWLTGRIRAMELSWRRPKGQEVSKGRVIRLACPVCGIERSATEWSIKRPVAGRPERWMPTVVVFECDACKTQFSPAACVERANGTWTVEPWQCAVCQAMNDAGSNKCRHCGAGGEMIE